MSDVTNVNPGNEYHDEVDEYRGSHRSDDAAPAPAGGATAAAAGGIPKRGLAMILIAVAAILLLWGIYALTQNDNAGTNAAPQTTMPQNTAPQNTAPQNTAPQATGSEAPAPEGAQPPAQEAPANRPEQEAPAIAPALTRENAQEFVYNNSPNPGAAGSTADQLAPQYNVANRSADSTAMNLPEQQYGIFPETTVFYDPSISGADQVAAEVARQVSGVVKPINEVPQGASLPAEVRGNREAVSVVLAG